MALNERSALLATAIALDLVFGEPPARLHPVVWIGRAITLLEQRAPASGPRRQFTYGVAATTAVVGGTAALASAVGRLPVSRPLRFGLVASVLKSTFAIRALLAASEGVRSPLLSGDLVAARAGLRALVSRESEGLPESLVAAAAIESLAENLTDSVLAPWLAYAWLGLPGAAAYRALNTLDSRIGYHGRYEQLGKAAARLDDLANLLPARAGALLIALVAPLGSASPIDAWRTARRDHARTESPNAGWTMAAMAGALGVTLEKRGAYRLGEGREPTADDLRRAQQIGGAALALATVLGLALTSLVNHRERNSSRVETS